MVFNKIKKLFISYKEYRKYDPVKNCKVYKEEGCSHIDGYLCDMRNCDILKGFPPQNNFFFKIGFKGNESVGNRIKNQV